MKISEFKEVVENIGVCNKLDLKVKEDDVYYHIMLGGLTCAIISKTNLYAIDTGYAKFINLAENVRRNLLEVVYEFAQTPIDSRNLFPKFYISSKLTPDDDEKFLFKFGGSVDHLAWGVKDGGGTEFTQDEIDYICEKFYTDLSDFIIEEVE